jgi:hypothetical protein
MLSFRVPGETMNKQHLLISAALAAMLPGAALAESLRCENGIASEGDSRLAIAYKCGPPLMRDSSCAPVFYRGSVNAVPEPFASAYVSCVHIEEWLYGRGPGNLLATVRLRGGTVQSITYGREPQ